ncbi:ABC transporter B family member 26, chloroplastic isoform X2 [Eucalyptus grandis]|uniref:ABC transporter B family member 26, chloroplastic isoform X2 n=1 Tax=Eucalyptus grandis TaxID=71139 RepID=UPI00192EE12F|nr:ABC transporter B family member 26, chloroplastic isoform X2 [Eucalyptus grandis]
MSSASRSSSLSLHDDRRFPHRHRSASGARPHRLSFPAKRQKFVVLRHLGSVGASFSVHFSLRSQGSGAERGVGFGSARSRWRSVASFLPGGGWWTLRGDSEDAGAADAKSVSVVTALRWIWGLIAEDRLVIYVAFGSLAVAALSEITMPSLLAASIFTAQSGCRDLFYRQVQLLGILCCTSGICSGLRSGCFAVANTILVKRLRETIFSTLVFQHIGFFDTKSVGDLMSRLGSDCQRLSHVIGNDMNLIIRNVLQGTGALVNLLSLSWPLTMSTLVICSVLSAVFLVYGRYQKNAAKLSQEFTAKANEVAEDTLTLMKTVRVYGTEGMEIGRYKLLLERLGSVSIREAAAYGLWNLSFHTLYRLTQVLALLLGGLSILTGYVSPEQLTKYILYCEWMIYATWRLADSLTLLLQSIGSSEEVFHLMSLSPSHQYLSKGLKIQKLRGHVQFVDVSFQYPSRITVPALANVNFSIQPNEVVAIVGASGCGKSSLVSLLLRLYDPVDGQVCCTNIGRMLNQEISMNLAVTTFSLHRRFILAPWLLKFPNLQIYIDGFPIKELDIRCLREKIGFVGQEPHLFHMDISSNISYGCSGKVNQEDVELAASQAGAHDFISTLPDGYQTVVHDGLLSGGQKQRIAIARAILRDPAILILDEATSALDAESERRIKGLIFNQTARTVIVIAHRLGTVENADRIIVMHGGRVVEVGTHKELLLRDGFYARLIRNREDSIGF